MTASAASAGVVSARTAMASAAVQAIRVFMTPPRSSKRPS
jgi:hypothetical protein